jgi:hypothetical protein
MLYNFDHSLEHEYIFLFLAKLALGNTVHYGLKAILEDPLGQLAQDRALILLDLT